MSDDPTADGIRESAVDTIHEWMPKRPDAAPGWLLALTGRDYGSGELRYELRPEDLALAGLPSLRYRVTITVEQEAAP
ncbi:hypothetical protein [Micromonospora sp. NPDC047730]|uniref:hypothetical protein n=1 Tax=Micromonospora sp. NPDC047730 TaxID=3364253 RepID=UPI00371C87FB